MAGESTENKIPYDFTSFVARFSIGRAFRIDLAFILLARVA
jgi:hypothetical protein